MNYSKIYSVDIANGNGFRVSLFVSGCSRKCPGCFNPEAQNPAFGKPFDDEAKQKIYKELENYWCKGLSLLGGEPMSKLSDNRKQIIEFAREVKSKFPDKDIWMWSGYKFEELAGDETSREILELVDVLVDGPFVEELKDLSLVWKGSLNQRVIDLKKTMACGKVVELA